MMTTAQLDVLHRATMFPLESERDLKHISVLTELCAEHSVADIARRYTTSPTTVRAWKNDFLRDGLRSIGHVRPGRGRPARIPGLTLTRAIHAIENFHGLPEENDEELAIRIGVSSSTMRRIHHDLEVDGRVDMRAHLLELSGILISPQCCALALCLDEATYRRGREILRRMEAGSPTPTQGQKTMSTRVALFFACLRVLSAHKPPHAASGKDGELPKKFRDELRRETPRGLRTLIIASSNGEERGEWMTRVETLFRELRAWKNRHDHMNDLPEAIRVLNRFLSRDPLPRSLTWVATEPQILFARSRSRHDLMERTAMFT